MLDRIAVKDSQLPPVEGKKPLPPPFFLAGSNKGPVFFFLKKKKGGPGFPPAPPSVSLGWSGFPAPPPGGGRGFRGRGRGVLKIFVFFFGGKIMLGGVGVKKKKNLKKPFFKNQNGRGPGI